jgi:hypothetical protein
MSTAKKHKRIDKAVDRVSAIVAGLEGIVESSKAASPARVDDARSRFAKIRRGKLIETTDLLDISSSFSELYLATICLAAPQPPAEELDLAARIAGLHEPLAEAIASAAGQRVAKVWLARAQAAVCVCAAAADLLDQSGLEKLNESFDPFVRLGRGIEGWARPMPQRPGDQANLDTRHVALVPLLASATLLSARWTAEQRHRKGAVPRTLDDALGGGPFAADAATIYQRFLAGYSLADRALRGECFRRAQEVLRSMLDEDGLGFANPR